MKPRVHISDHALVRYIERVKGFDVEKIRKEIEELVAPTLGTNATAISANGFTFVIKGGYVTTVVPGSTPAGAKRKSAEFRGNKVRRVEGEMLVRCDALAIVHALRQLPRRPWAARVRPRCRLPEHMPASRSTRFDRSGRRPFDVHLSRRRRSNSW